GQEVANGLPCFVGREAIPPVQSDEGIQQLGVQEVRGGDLDCPLLSIQHEFPGRRGERFGSDLPLNDDPTIDEQPGRGRGHCPACPSNGSRSSSSRLVSSMISSMPTGRVMGLARMRRTASSSFLRRAESRTSTSAPSGNWTPSSSTTTLPLTVPLKRFMVRSPRWLNRFINLLSPHPLSGSGIGNPK